MRLLHWLLWGRMHFYVIAVRQVSRYEKLSPVLATFASHINIQFVLASKWSRQGKFPLDMSTVHVGIKVAMIARSGIRVISIPLNMFQSFQSLYTSAQSRNVRMHEPHGESRRYDISFFSLLEAHFGTFWPRPRQEIEVYKPLTQFSRARR